MNKLWIVLLVGIATAQTPVAPVGITAEQRATFWRASLEKTRADVSYQAIIADMTASCEKIDQAIGLDAKGEPGCTNKKEPKGK